MRGKCGSSLRTSAVDHIEDSGRQPGCGDDLGKDVGVDGRLLARFQHHRATGCNSRRNLATDLIQGPVPGRDKSTCTDRFFDDIGRTANLLETEIPEELDNGTKVRHAGTDLSGTSQAHRRTHLAANGPRQLGNAISHPREDVLNNVNALVNARLRPQRKCRPGGSGRRIHIFSGSKRNGGKGCFTGGIDHVQLSPALGRDPFTINVKLIAIQSHGVTPVLCSI